MHEVAGVIPASGAAPRTWIPRLPVLHSQYQTRRGPKGECYFGPSSGVTFCISDSNVSDDEMEAVLNIALDDMRSVLHLLGSEYNCRCKVVRILNFAIFHMKAVQKCFVRSAGHSIGQLQTGPGLYWLTYSVRVTSYVIERSSPMLDDPRALPTVGQRWWTVFGVLSVLKLASNERYLTEQGSFSLKRIPSLARIFGSVVW